MAYQDVQKVAEKRRTIYALNKNLPLPAAEVAKIIEHAVLHTPSSFNSQSTRVVVLFGAEHEKLWQITEDALRAIVPADKFEPTAQKLAMFKAAAGSVLFFEDQEVVQGLQANFPAYADNFPVWAEHTDAMHQYAVWTTLAEAGNLGQLDPGTLVQARFLDTLLGCAVGLAGGVCLHDPRVRSAIGRPIRRLLGVRPDLQ